MRDAALKLKDWFPASASGSAPTPAGKQAATDSQLAREEVGERGQPNKPLGFQLKGIDHRHSYLTGRGIDAETAEYFGLGFFSGKGSMSGRVAIPIENEKGELVAYAGRSVDGSEPKYKLPAGFKKSQVLYNLKTTIHSVVLRVLPGRQIHGSSTEEGLQVKPYSTRIMRRELRASFPLSAHLSHEDSGCLKFGVHSIHTPPDEQGTVSPPLLPH